MESSRQFQRGSEGWAAVVERWRSSGLSVEAFCRLEGINRSGFYRWRSLLGSGSAPRRGVVRADAQAQGGFVDLGTLGARAGVGGASGITSGSGRWLGVDAGARLMFFPEGVIRVHFTDGTQHPKLSRAAATLGTAPQ